MQDRRLVIPIPGELAERLERRVLLDDRPLRDEVRWLIQFALAELERRESLAPVATDQAA